MAAVFLRKLALFSGLLTCKYQFGQKMGRAALSRRAIDRPCVSKLELCSSPAGRCLFAAKRATYCLYRPQLDGPKLAHLKWEGLSRFFLMIICTAWKLRIRLLCRAMITRVKIRPYCIALKQCLVLVGCSGGRSINRSWSQTGQPLKRYLDNRSNCAVVLWFG